MKRTKPPLLILSIACALILLLISGCAPPPPYPTPIPCGDTPQLIDAIHYANTTPALDVIELEACDYPIDHVEDDLNGYTGLPPIITPIRIVGNGAVLFGANPQQFRLILVGINGQLELSDLTLTKGYAVDPVHPTDVARNSGGAIRNLASLYLNQVTIQENGASGVAGGIFNEGDLIIRNSTIHNNSQDANSWAMGGALALHNRMGSSAEIFNSTISGHADNFYTITNSETAYLSLTNSTVSGNGGTALNNDGDMDLTYVTIANNPGGISSVWYGIPNIRMVGVLLNNTSLDCNIGTGVLISSIANMDHDGSCNATYTVLSPAMQLGPLADNGGGTLTHALLPGSPAIEAAQGVQQRVCPVPEDQRGITRPVNAFCDIGAYEYEGAAQPVQIDTPTPTTTPTITPTPTPTLTPTPEVTRCDLFDGENATVTTFDIPIYTTNQDLYVEFPHPLWGLEEPVPGDDGEWVYAALLGSTPATECTYEGYSGRVYCDFVLPEAALDTALQLEIYVNECAEPIYVHPWVSIFDPDVPGACKPDLGPEQCKANGGKYNVADKKCNCP